MAQFILECIGGPLVGTELGTVDPVIDANNNTLELDFGENAVDMGDQIARYVYRLTNKGTVGATFALPFYVPEQHDSTKLRLTTHSYAVKETVTDKATGDVYCRADYVKASTLDLPKKTK